MQHKTPPRVSWSTVEALLVTIIVASAFIVLYVCMAGAALALLEGC